MNESRLKTASHTLGDSMRCECECHRVECASSFEITVGDYEGVRADGRHFVVTPGHESDDESIISMHDAFVVVEKLGEQGRLADALNPR